MGSGEDLQIAAMVDRAEDYSSDPLLGVEDWVGAKYVSIGQGSVEELEDLGDVDTGDPAPLADFIAQGIADHPAERYALVISDHGASWPGVGGDEGSGNSLLTLEDLRSGIADGLDAAGVEKLDLLGFDACLMATYETASALAPLADRMIASQELEPGHGWDYRAFQVLADDPATDVDTLGTAIIDGFAAQAEAEGTGADITLSMIDLARMADVDTALADFSSALGERAATVAPVVGRQRATVLGFGKDADPTVDTHMADLGLLAGQIGVEALDVSAEADALITAIDDAVPYKIAGPAALGASGLSIYFPPTADLLNPDYAYYAPGETEEYRDVTLTITFDPESGDVLNETYYGYTEAGTYGELTADPEGLIVPKLLVVAPDGTQSWEPAADVGLFADLPNLQYGFEPLASGTALSTQLTVTDFGGNSDSVSAEVVVP